jgi:hypothetical protein
MKSITSKTEELGNTLRVLAFLVLGCVHTHLRAQVLFFESVTNVNRFVGYFQNLEITGLTMPWGYDYAGNANFHGVSPQPNLGFGMRLKLSESSPILISATYREVIWEGGHKANYEPDMNNNYYKFIYPFHSLALGISCRVWQSENKRVKWYAGIQFERPGLGSINKGEFYGWHVINNEWRDLPDNSYLNLYSQVDVIPVSPRKNTSVTSSIEYAIIDKGPMLLGFTAHLYVPRNPTIHLSRPIEAYVVASTIAVMTSGTGIFCALRFNKSKTTPKP